MKKIRLILAGLLLLIGSVLSAQNLKVTGVVTDLSDKSPLSGATVKVKGTSTGVICDLNGEFIINADRSAILEVSFIGMQTIEVPVNGRTTINVQLQSDAVLLSETVIIGYGTAKKVGNVVGTINQVNSEKIQNKPVANVMDALQGQVAGLQVYTSSGEPSATSSVRLRGVGSLTAGNTPLYVLDGIPIDPGTMVSLNPNDFESVTVLKDASATSIYGSRAANGVIYITTKRGKINEDAKISFNAQYGVSSLANKSFLSPMNSSQLLAHQLEYNIITQTRHDELKATGYDTRWVDYFFNDNVPTYQGDLSIQGGGGRTIYFLSGGYFKQQGTTPRSDFERYSFRSNIESQVKKWLRVGANISGSYDERQNNGYTFQASNSLAGGIFGSILRQPYYNPYGENGEILDVIPGVNAYSPYYLLAKQPSVGKNVQFNGNAFVQLTPFEGLTIKSQAGMDAYDYRSSSKRLPSYLGSLNNGRVAESFTRGVTRTITNTIEYKFDVNERHEFSVLAGQEGIDYSYDSFGASTTGHTDDRLVLLTAGPTNENPTNSKAEYSYLSYFARADYNLDGKYFADISIRNDASSRFGKENRNATFYSAGVMWNIKNESFLKPVNFLSKLNLKMSVGTTGNSSIGNYDHFALVGTNQYNGQTGWAVSSAGNPQLGWETQMLANIGVNTEFFERIRFELDYYIRTTQNMLMSVPVPYTSGFSTILQNVGSMKNSGIDIMLGIDVIKTKNTYFGINKTFNYNKNEITKLFYDLDEWVVPNTGVGYVVGRPVEFYYPVYAGVDPTDGMQMWKIPGTDETTKTFNEAALKQMTGKPRYAPISGGLSLNFSWKGIGLNADFSYVLGKYIVNNDRYFSENPYNFRGYNQSSRVLSMWKAPGDLTEMPKYGQIMQFDTHLLENASFLRMKSITLSYTFPRNILNGVFQNVKLYASGRNLFTITNYLGADPEIDSNLTYGAYPNSKQVNFGVQLAF